MRTYFSLLLLAASTFVAAAVAAPANTYVFGWHFIPGDTMQPRGGMTAGKAVTPDTAPSPAWGALQEADLEPFERDRRAILAMAGEYRTSFDFIETAGFTPDYHPPRPYRSWGTEKVYVIEDRGDFISLQHVLVMRILGADGIESAPMVTKHWRQDWSYEPDTVLVYRGQNSWEAVDVDQSARRGAWSQTVYQVDDSPRYGDIARWAHFGNYSSWASADGWRPLPRREFSTRDDYQVLIGSNRHIIVPTGWVHEQHNNKVVLDTRSVPDSERAVLAREIGINRYERITGYDFTAGDRYLAATAALWRAVRVAWADLAAMRSPLQLRGAPDRDQLFLPLWSLADEIAGGAAAEPAALAAQVSKLVGDYLRAPAAAGQRVEP